MIKVSVIIPAYNAEKTLSKAIDSVLAQTLTDIEIIVVDDGSADNTRSIIQSYGSKVKPILKDKNEGLSAARNSALEVAIGKYITYVDADDYIEPDFYERVFNLSNDADLVVSGSFHDALDDNGNVVVSTINRINSTTTLMSKEEIAKMASELDSKRLFAFTWNKLYKREFLEKENIKFQNRVLIEDFAYNCEIWPLIGSLVITDVVGYHYVKFSNESLSLKYLPDFLDIMNDRYNLIKGILVNADIYDGNTKEKLSNMHIKHIMAGFVRLFSNKSNLSFFGRYNVIRKYLLNGSSIEVMKQSKGERFQEKVTNAIFKSRSAILNYLFAKLIYKMQTSKFKLFDRMK